MQSIKESLKFQNVRRSLHPVSSARPKLVMNGYLNKGEMMNYGDEMENEIGGV